jgi:hypothetical protein
MLSVAELTKRHLKSKEINLTKAGKKIPGLLFKQMIPFTSNDEAAIIANLKACFLLISGAAGKKLGKKLVDEQEIVMNLADILAEGFLAEAAYLRVQKLKTNKMVDADEIAVMEKIVKVYLYEALDMVRTAGNEIIDAYTSGMNQKTMRYLLSLLTKRYDINAKDLRRDIAEHAYLKKGYSF